MFKVGQRVVCIKKTPWISEYYPETAHLNSPKEDEIVTIRSFCPTHKDAVDIKEYPVNGCGVPQSFSVEHFRPIDESFAEEAIENIKEWVEETQTVKIEEA